MDAVSLILPGEYPSLRISPTASDAVEQCKLDVYEDIYASVYVKQSLLFWVQE
jgi:hypothetical protein